MTEQPAVEEFEVEVLDLDSDDDKENKRAVRKKSMKSKQFSSDAESTQEPRNIGEVERLH